MLIYDLSHFCTNFQKNQQKTCPNIRSLLFLCKKQLHKKFAPILVVCQRWRHSEKKKKKNWHGFWSRRDFELQFFKKIHVFWRCFSWKSKITYVFWIAVPLQRGLSYSLSTDFQICFPAYPTEKKNKYLRPQIKK